MKPTTPNRQIQKPAQSFMEPAKPAPVSEIEELDESLLAELGGNTGLDEIDNEDVKLPLYSWNMKWKDPRTNRPIAIDVFFNTLTEEYKPTVRCVLLRLKKTHRMASYIDGVGTRVICRSMDRVTGVMEDGSTRSCANCPDFRWHAEADGKGGTKRTKPCALNYHFIAYDLDTKQPFIFRVKGTSVEPVKIYLNRHFLKKRRTTQGWADLPLYVFETILSLKMSDNCNYSILEMDRGEVLPAEMVREFHAVSKEFADLDHKELDREQPEIQEGENVDVPLTRLVKPVNGESAAIPHF
jgi:hypothetical protein